MCASKRIEQFGRWFDIGSLPARDDNRAGVDKWVEIVVGFESNTAERSERARVDRDRAKGVPVDAELGARQAEELGRHAELEQT